MTESFNSNAVRVVSVIVLSIFCFLAVVAIIFRLWARKVQRARLELNDYLCVAGLVFALGLSIFSINSEVNWDLGDDSLTEKSPSPALFAIIVLQAKGLLVGVTLWATAVFFIRASILQLYIHLFRTTKPFLIACYVVHAINFAFFASNVLAVCLICRPLSARWDRTVPGASCGEQRRLDEFLGVFNLLMDAAMVILPMPVLWGLQMTMRRKIVLSFIFGMGIVICVVTLIRVWITSLITPDGSNAPKIYSIIAFLTCLEALLGVINACLPVMKPVFTKFNESKIYGLFSKTLSPMSASTYGSSSQGGTTNNSSSMQKPSSKRYKSKNGARAGIFGTNKELQAWPSSKVSTTAGSPDSNMHRFVDNKAAQIMFSHTTTTSRGGSPIMDNTTTPPRPPPKSKYYRPDRTSGEMGDLEIVVQKDWDVERGEREKNSSETARELLRDGGRAW